MHKGPCSARDGDRGREVAVQASNVAFPYSSLWDGWLSDRVTNIQTLNELRREFRQNPPRVLHIQNIWKRDVALQLSSLLLKMPYSRVQAIQNANGEVVEVDDSKWLETAVERRWYRHAVVRPIEQVLDGSRIPVSSRQLLCEFLLFTARGPLFRSWLSMVTGLLYRDQASLEFGRYDKGDFIAPHDDYSEGRSISVSFYLDPNWIPQCGGLLGFSSYTRADQMVPPLFNSVSVIPIASTCRHWVQEWRGPLAGRHTVSLGFYGDGSSTAE
jgi:hypothetical protein